MEYKVLAADDETELLDALELYTERENIRLIKADNGLAALELFKSEKPHLVLLDIMLPEVDGYELLEYIKPTGTPVIFLTAKGSISDKVRGLKAGADDYLAKPFKSEAKRS